MQVSIQGISWNTNLSAEKKHKSICWQLPKSSIKSQIISANVCNDIIRCGKDVSLKNKKKLYFKCYVEKCCQKNVNVKDLQRRISSKVTILRNFFQSYGNVRELKDK